AQNFHNEFKEFRGNLRRWRFIRDRDPNEETPHLVFSCIAPMVDCDGLDITGCEANLNSSANCGGCGVQCAGGQMCKAQSCVSSTESCDAPLTPCSGDCTDTLSDPWNCGSCGNTCPW